MTAKWIEWITGSLDDKRRYRAYRARAGQLPGGYATATEGLERYLIGSGSVRDGGVLLQMLDDLADLMEQSATDGTPVRDVVGDDPVEFAETFLRNYSQGDWRDGERRRLVEAIERAEVESTGGTS